MVGRRIIRAIGFVIGTIDRGGNMDKTEKNWKVNWKIGKMSEKKPKKIEKNTLKPKVLCRFLGLVGNSKIHIREFFEIPINNRTKSDGHIIYGR